MRNRLWAWAGGIAAIASGATAQVIERPQLGSAFQQDLAQAAIKSCAASGHAVAVAISDDSGVVRTLLSADGVSALAVEVAQRKARTAARVGQPTGMLGKAAQAAPGYGDFLRSADAGFVLIGGGMPLRVRGRPVGGIGVGGAPGPEADEHCAQAALSLLAERLP